MPDRIFTFEIEEHFGTISSRGEGWNKELNLIRWNGGAAKYDIREWDQHHERMRKGVTLSLWEMRKLIELFTSRNNDAAVARGRAIEAERNARRIAARQNKEAVAVEAETAIEPLPVQTATMDQMDQTEQVEQETLEGAMAPIVSDNGPELITGDGETPEDVAEAVMQEEPF